MNKELELWRFTAKHLSDGQRVMFLVVAESSGSSPGRPGYKMAVAQDGELCGSIGGGVMEVNLVEQSRDILSQPHVLADGPDLSVREQVHRKNVPNSSGMICAGKQTVIFKMLTLADLHVVKQAVAAFENRTGEGLTLSYGSIDVGTPEGMSQNADLTFERMADNEFEYLERLGKKNDLFIIGGGHCALALSDLMSKMDFHIRLFDDRPQLNTIEKNEFADEITVIDTYDQVGQYIEPGGHSYVVVMTLGYKTDRAVIRQLIDRDLKYFGVLGSKAKMATLFRELIDEGTPKEQLDRIHSPIGIQINSHSPEEIAVSIAAEIIAVKNESD